MSVYLNIPDASNIELNDLRKNICLTKSEASVGRIPVCNVRFG